MTEPTMQADSILILITDDHAIGCPLIPARVVLVRTPNIIVSVGSLLVELKRPLEGAVPSVRAIRVIREPGVASAWRVLCVVQPFGVGRAGIVESHVVLGLEGNVVDACPLQDDVYAQSAIGRNKCQQGNGAKRHN